MIANRLHTIRLFSLLSLCMIPTKINAGGEAVQHGYRFTAAQKGIIIAVITATLLVCSDEAQDTTKRATIRSILACLNLLQKLPSSDAMKQKIQAKIDYLETIYTTRADNVPTPPATKEIIILKILKILKEVIDTLKAAEWALG